MKIQMRKKNNGGHRIILRAISLKQGRVFVCDRVGCSSVIGY